MKPILRLSLAIFLALSSSGGALARTFPDAQGTRYSEAFSYLSTLSIVHGFPDGTARPFDLLTRSEALKVILSSDENLRGAVASIEGKLPDLPLFVDIDQWAWYAPYVETAFAHGIITGYADRTFRPGRSVTTEEAITMLLRMSSPRDDVAFESRPELPNIPSQWFTDDLSRALRMHLVSSRESMRIGQSITRGQFMDMAYRLHVATKEGLTAFNRPEPSVPAPVPSEPRLQAIPSPSARPQPSVPGNSILSYASDRYFSITIPTLGVKDLLVTHPSDPFSSQGILSPLKTGVGHLFSYPGAGGKVLIYGHSSGYPWDVSAYTKIFRQVNKLKRGDRVYVTYNQNLYEYEVSFEEAVPASDTSRYSGSGEELILYTCWPPDSIAERYLVHAFPVKTVALR